MYPEKAYKFHLADQHMQRGQAIRKNLPQIWNLIQNQLVLKSVPLR